MEDLKGYQIQKEAVFENGRGFALAHNPEAQSPSVIWHFTVMPEGERNYYGYTACRGILPPEKNLRGSCPPTTMFTRFRNCRRAKGRW